MQLESKRLILRMLVDGDAEAYFYLSQNEGFRLYQISNYQRSSIGDAQGWIEKLKAYHDRNSFGIFGVFKKKDSVLIGLCALKYLEVEQSSPVELMYRISDLHWGHAYGLEISETLVKFAFNQLSLKNLVATVDPQNLVSKKILSRLGFQFQKLIKIESYVEELHELKNIGKS